jgi:hypothetical protein
MRKKVIWLLVIFIIVVTQSACQNKYDDFETQFMKEYYKIIENVDSTEVKDILSKLQSNENAVILENLNQLLKDNEDLRKDNEKKYDNLKELYTGLVELKNSYKDWDNLNLDRKLYLNSKIDDIYFYISQSEYYKK